MQFKSLAARTALVSACLMMTATPAQARFWQCAPFARMISGISIRGNANTWWSQAAGRYLRGSLPKVGAVLAFGFFAPSAAAAASVAKQPETTQAPTVAAQLSVSAPVDVDRVQKIKQAVADGNFPLSPTTIADALIAARYEWMSHEPA